MDEWRLGISDNMIILHIFDRQLNRQLSYQLSSLVPDGLVVGVNLDMSKSLDIQNKIDDPLDIEHAGNPIFLSRSMADLLKMFEWTGCFDQIIITCAKNGEQISKSVAHFLAPSAPIYLDDKLYN